MNNVSLIGRLTQDPELRTTGSGISQCTFTLAVDGRPSASGEPHTDFIRCVAWRNQAENLCKFQHKGSQIGVTGHIQTGQYDAQDGTKRYVTEVVVDNVEFVGGKNESSSSSTPSEYVDRPSEAPVDEMPEYDIPKSDPYENYDKEVSLSDNDLPF